MEPSFLRRVLITAGVTGAAIVGALTVWYGADVLLLLFAGILLALLLRGAADWFARYAPLSPGGSLAVVVAGLVAVFGLAGWLLADDVTAQVNELIDRLPQALGHLEERLGRTAWGRFVLARIPTVETFTAQTGLRRATGILSTAVGTTIGALINVVVVAFVALYVAADPDV